MPASRDRRPVVAILCKDETHRPPHLDAIEQRADVRYTDAAGLAAAVEGAEALFLWDFFSGAVRDVWDHAGSLRWIHVAAAGVDKLLFDDLRTSGVVVTNARGVFDRPIAEYVLMCILAQAKDTRRGYELQLAHEWRHRETRRVAGTTALVVGTGGIGRETARLLRAVGMRVMGAGRTARDDDPDFGTVIDSADLASHVGWADHLVVVAPLTPLTRGIVDRKVLSRMKATAHLVNVGRGETVVEADLVASLRSREIAAASLDVFETEPLPPDHPLWDAEGVAITPHMSGDAVGWLDTLARQFVDNALRWLDGDQMFNVVDKQLGYVPAGAAAQEDR